MPPRRPGFPKNLLEFQTRFATEETCEAYLAECRWPDGFRCPQCDGEKAWALPARRLRECAACGHQTSTTAGTILHRTRTPLRVWFWAAYLMITDTRGISARGLQKRLGLARYETAWMMLHKLRRATVNLNRGLLTGRVEVDDTWVGGHQAGGSGRKREGRHAALVVMALEVRDGHPERLRARLVPDDTSASLIGFVKDVVEPGATIITDGFQSYRALPAAEYEHKRIVEGSGSTFTNPVPHLHQAIGNMKALLNGTHRFVSRRHLAVYLDEFAFRHNRRLDLDAAFQTLLDMGTSRGPTTLRHDHRRAGPAEGGVHPVGKGARTPGEGDATAGRRDGDVVVRSLGVESKAMTASNRHDTDPPMPAVTAILDRARRLTTDEARRLDAALRQGPDLEPLARLVLETTSATSTSGRCSTTGRTRGTRWSRRVFELPRRSGRRPLTAA